MKQRVCPCFCLSLLYIPGLYRGDVSEQISVFPKNKNEQQAASRIQGSKIPNHSATELSNHLTNQYESRTFLA